MTVQRPTPGHYQKTLKCYSPIYTDLSDGKQREISEGGKIMLPPSELQPLMDDPNIPSTMMFRAQKDSEELTTKRMHCGVQEFTAPDGTVIFPQWMMDNLGVLNGKGVIFFFNWQ